MHKKARITLKLKPGETPKVTLGAAVSRGDILTQTAPEEIAEFNLAQLLHINPLQLSKFLTITPGTKVEKGTVLARKSGVLKKQIIKSPISGTFTMVSKEKGIVGIQKDTHADGPMVSWFDGIVAELNAEKIVFEVIGTLISAIGGKGQPVSGKLLVFTDEITALTMPTDVEGYILAVKTAHSDLIAKADTLGALALIAETQELPLFSLPFLIMEKIDDLVRFQQKTVILHGDEKELLIIESEQKPKSHATKK